MILMTQATANLVGIPRMCCWKHLLPFDVGGVGRAEHSAHAVARCGARSPRSQREVFNSLCLRETPTGLLLRNSSAGSRTRAPVRRLPFVRAVIAGNDSALSLLRGLACFNRFSAWLMARRRPTRAGHRRNPGDSVAVENALCGHFDSSCASAPLYVRSIGPAQHLAGSAASLSWRAIYLATFEACRCCFGLYCRA